MPSFLGCSKGVSHMQGSRRFPILLLSVVAMGFLLMPSARAAEAKGKIKSIDADNRKIVVVVDDKDVTLKVKEDCKITVAGEKAVLSDLKADQKVTVTFTTEDEQNLAG